MKHFTKLEQDSYNVRVLSILLFSFFILPFLFFDFPAFGQEAAPKAEEAYRSLPYLNSRIIMWVASQLHLNFAAFIVAVPTFALIAEFIGYKSKDERYDKLAKDFTRLLTAAFSVTAILGAILVFLLIVLYPKFAEFLSRVFKTTMVIYPLLFFGETFTMYIYYYGWDSLKGNKKPVHLILGIFLNIFGLSIMAIANSWASFMMTPGGVNESGRLLSLWQATNNFAWMPLNIHRFIANIAFGGAIAGAYAAINFLNAKTQEERSYYDWMGYIGNFIAVSALIPLPFAGYWLGIEIYKYDQQMGITMMGGVFSWLFIVQAVLIGALFLGANYYLWIGMERIKGAERYRGYIKYLIAIIALCFMVWMTPHSLVASMEEARKMGGMHHPFLGVLGVMSAKNTAVNMMILATFISFVLYRRGNRVPTVSWARVGNFIFWSIVALAFAVVIFLGVYGYYVETIVRIRFSMIQVAIVIIGVLVLGTIIDVLTYRKARVTGEIEWGKMPARSQYMLIFLAVSFTWLMGLMGYVRAGLRLHWHVYKLMQDTSPQAYTPTLGYATTIVSAITLVFFLLVAFIFFIANLGIKPEEKKVLEEKGALAPAAGGAFARGETTIREDIDG